MQGYNVTSQGTEQAARTLSLAMQGQTTALRRMGVIIDDTTKKRLMAMDEEKRAIELSKIITGVTGNLNEEMAKTPFGRMAQDSNRLGDSYEKLGAALLPLQATMMGIWTDIVEKATNNLDVLVPIALGALGLISAGFIALKWEAITAWAAAAAFCSVLAK